MSVLIKQMIFFKNLIWEWFFVFVIIAGCAHPISDDLRKNIDHSASLETISRNPNRFTNQNVMFGGVIVATRNFPEKTEIEVIQKNLDSLGYPSRGDETEGRFIFVKQGFLEPEIFSKGRYITGAGKLAGTKNGKIGNLEMELPLIEVAELRLWEDLSKVPYGSYSFPYYYGPYVGPFSPYNGGLLRFGYPWR